MNDMESSDVKLLQYIYDYPGFDKAIAFENFSLSSNARIDNLLDKGFVYDNRTEMPETDKSKYLGLYSITDKGISFLEDYKLRKINEKKDFYIKSVITPIAVSAITTLITLWLSKLL